MPQAAQSRWATWRARPIDPGRVPDGVVVVLESIDRHPHTWVTVSAATPIGAEGINSFARSCLGAGVDLALPQALEPHRH